ncbi:hypothetical protein VU13_02075 [Desulfobulbus sp. US5]|nr:hypothetical protein [Desulfobulbus sp. US5]
MRAQLKMVLFLSTLLVLISGQAQGADIIVDAGGICTLADAITAVNNDADTGGCVASGIYGDDTITLAADVFLSVALPQVTTTITLEGDGHKIDGQNNSAVGSVLTIGSEGDLA